MDIARGLAILAMIVFHFVRDLEMFQVIAAGTTLTGGWAFMARAIASSFLFLVGVSIVLAHPEQTRWAAFGREFLIISAAALLVSLASWAAMPERFIYFGILHAIAFASVLGIVFVRTSAWVAAAVAIADPGNLVCSRTRPALEPLVGLDGAGDVSPARTGSGPGIPLARSRVLGNCIREDLAAAALEQAERTGGFCDELAGQAQPADLSSASAGADRFNLACSSTCRKGLAVQVPVSRFGLETAHMTRTRLSGTKTTEHREIERRTP